MATGIGKWFEFTMKHDGKCLQCGKTIDAHLKAMARTNGLKPNGKPNWEFLCNGCNALNAGPPTGTNFGSPSGAGGSAMDTLEQARQHLKAEADNEGQEMTIEEENHLFGAPEKFSERWFEQNAVWGRI